MSDKSLKALGDFLAAVGACAVLMLVIGLVGEAVTRYGYMVYCPRPEMPRVNIASIAEKVWHEADINNGALFVLRRAEKTSLPPHSFLQWLELSGQTVGERTRLGQYRLFSHGQAGAILRQIVDRLDRTGIASCGGTDGIILSDDRFDVITPMSDLSTLPVVIVMGVGTFFRTENESELAGVVAHGIADICLKQPQYRLIKEREFEKLALEWVGDAKKANEIANAAREMLIQEHRQKADVLAQKMLEKAGYDPTAYLRLRDRSVLFRGGRTPGAETGSVDSKRGAAYITISKSKLAAAQRAVLKDLDSRTIYH